MQRATSNARRTLHAREQELETSRDRDDGARRQTLRPQLNALSEFSRSVIAKAMPNRCVRTARFAGSGLMQTC